VLTHRIPVPTPFPVGAVNAYLLGPDPLTLVDCGPRTQDSWAALVAGIAAAGRSVGEIERVVLTHCHPDHVGLARRVRDVSGCTVLAHPADHARLTGAPGEWERIVGFIAEACRRAGSPDGVLRDLAGLLATIPGFTEDLDEVSALVGGGTLAFDGQCLDVLATPGHAGGALCLWDPAGRTLLTGDTLLPHISSNAILEPEAEGFRNRALCTYLETLGRVESLRPRTCLPGHGEAFSEAVELIRQRRSFHEARAEKVLALVSAGLERPWEIARALFPDAEAGYAHLAVSEVVGHLDLLAGAGRVLFEGEGDPWVARPTAGDDGRGQASQPRARSTARSQPA
jgi:glyoxylase-like metal-dependent hydrolase (beta-lactamase superfamily II)